MREKGKCAQNTKGKKEVLFFNFRLFFYATPQKVKQSFFLSTQKAW